MHLWWWASVSSNHHSRSISSLGVLAGSIDCMDQLSITMLGEQTAIPTSMTARPALMISISIISHGSRGTERQGLSMPQYG